MHSYYINLQKKNYANIYPRISQGIFSADELHTMRSLGAALPAPPRSGFLDPAIDGRRLAALRANTLTANHKPNQRKGARVPSAHGQEVWQARTYAPQKYRAGPRLYKGRKEEEDQPDTTHDPRPTTMKHRARDQVPRGSGRTRLQPSHLQSCTTGGHCTQEAAESMVRARTPA